MNKEILEKLGCCILADNSIDYVIDELIWEEQHGWDKLVEGAVNEAEQLLKDHPKFESLYAPLPKGVDDWDRRYEDYCHKIIGRKDRLYKEWKEKQENKVVYDLDTWAKIIMNHDN